MNNVPNSELLEQFAQNRSEAAFAVLVQRHIGLVYTVAFRKTRKRQHARDITQTVFSTLAHRAGSLGTNTVIPGWLYYTARLVAANFQQAEMHNNAMAGLRMKNRAAVRNARHGKRKSR